MSNNDFIKLDLQMFAEEPPTDETEETKEDGADDTAESGEDQKSFSADYVKDLRSEAAKYRTEKKKFEEKAVTLEQQLKAIQKALGLEGEEPDADQLQKQLAEKDKQLRTLRVENAFSKVASAEGADAELTLAVLERQGELNSLELDDKLEENIKKLVKKALEKNPKLKATEPSKAGDDQSGSDDGKSTADMNSWIRKQLGRG